MIITRLVAKCFRGAICAGFFIAGMALPIAGHNSALAQDGDETAEQVDPVWAFETSDIPVDPKYHFGVLDNGMRYVIRSNDRPEGTALVRLHISSGSLAEQENERGLAHFLEHMAFNGSRRVPEGEMVKLLEREGLAFGADTNASTGFESTSYRLDLPRNDPALLDTALMLMRETASELLLDPEAIDRERGIILSERRDRRNFSQRELEDRFEFLTPGARYTQRLPIGIREVLETATADDFRAFYEREYVPVNAVVLVVGDFDVDTVEGAIKAHFDSWQKAPAPQKPVVGPVDLSRSDETHIYLDPALSERIRISRHTGPRNSDDSVAKRQQNLLTSIGYGIINRRLQRLALGENAPYRSAGFGTGRIFDIGRTTNIVIDTADGLWEPGMDAAVTTLRTALAFGFSESEVAEQIASIRTSQNNAVSAADTRGNASLINAATSLITQEIVPSTAQSSLERFESFAPYVTPAAVLAAVREDAARLINPLIRFQGRVAPKGGKAALRKKWNELIARKLTKPAESAAIEFGYTDFGPPGSVVSDMTDARLNIRQIRFSNGVMLNLKQTDLSKDRVSYRMSVDGGSLLNTRDNPLATSMVSVIPAGGLGKHSRDELQTALAGRNADMSISSGGDVFVSSGTTTNRDIELQLQLLAATLTDPGYRKEGETRYRRSVTNYYKTLDSTPGRALSAALGGIVSDQDPRFTLQSEKDTKARSYALLDKDIGDRLRSGALEIGIVGDFDADEIIKRVASTLGALPARENEFLPRTSERQRGFTRDRSLRTLRHKGEDDQALIYMVWPTRDDSDLRAAQELELLERIARLALQAELREKLGKTYSPSASSSLSSIYTDYGTFSLTASIDVAEIDATRSALSDAIAKLRDEPVGPDTLERARKPLLEAYDNALKSNGSWLRLVDRAQSRSDDIDRFLAAKDVIASITALDIQRTAQKYLQDDDLLEVRVVPETTQDVSG